MKKEYIAEIEYEANKMVDIVESLLKRQEKEIIKEIEKLRDNTIQDYPRAYFQEGYNQAIEDIIKTLN